MKKLLFLSFCLVITALNISAQNRLTVENVTHAEDVYKGGDNQAGLKVIAQPGLSLRFASSTDKSATPFLKRVEGSDSVYYLSFPTGNEFSNRKLTIMADGFDTVEYPLSMISGQLVKLSVRDAAKPVVENVQNVLVTADTLNYAPVDTLNTAIADATSTNALPTTQQAVRRNSYNTTSTLRETDPEMEAIFQEAEDYYNRYNYKKSRKLYEVVVANHGNRAELAQKRLNAIEQRLHKYGRNSEVITYEYMKNVPIGIHYGVYKDQRFGGYVHLNLNPKIISALNDKGKIGDQPEIDFGFGFTHKIISPVWIYGGVGLTAKLYFGDYLEGKYPNKDGKPEQISDVTDYTADKPDQNFSASVNPEVGIVVKYSYFAIRFGYTYRIAFTKELQDYMNRSILNFGIGVAI